MRAIRVAVLETKYAAGKGGNQPLRLASVPLYRRSPIPNNLAQEAFKMIKFVRISYNHRHLRKEASSNMFKLAI